MTLPIVKRLRFAISEFMRCLKGITDEEATHRLLPMNCMGWMVGHIAAQEQYYLEFFPNWNVTHPFLNKLVGFGRPASTPPLEECVR